MLVLTNAMRPMMKLAKPLLALKERYGRRLVVRVSLDHYSRDLHEFECGPRGWEPALAGLEWLAANGFVVHVAGRRFSGEVESVPRAGYARLFREHAVPVGAYDPAQMCAPSRMVLKRKGVRRSSVVSCTLLPYQPQFGLGRTLREASGSVPLNHPHCARFCVLGGASCSASG